jgi:hypothetical protein
LLASGVAFFAPPLLRPRVLALPLAAGSAFGLVEPFALLLVVGVALAFGLVAPFAFGFGRAADGRFVAARPRELLLLGFVAIRLSSSVEVTGSSSCQGASYR